MKIVWDKVKSAKNLVKHDIDFETAQRVFDDPYQLSEQDRIEGHEYRWQTSGMIKNNVVMVGHNYEVRDGEEIIRIITARLATPKERRRYHEDTNDS